MRPLPFSIGQALGRSVDVSSQECENLFPVAGGDKGQVTLYGTPGTELFSTFGSNPVRGWRQVGDYVYFVSRDTFYRMSNNGTLVSKGTVNTTGGNVVLSDNGDYDGSIADEIIIVDGTDGYIFNITADTLTALTRTGDSAGFPVCEWVVFLNGRFIAGEAGTGRIFWSSLYEGTKWDALAFATAEKNPDDISMGKEINGLLWLFGEKYIEVWGVTTSADLPFSPIGGAGGSVGLAAKWSVAKRGQALRFIGTDEDGNLSFYETQGYQLADASDTWLDYQLNQLTDYADATAFSYSLEGHTFYYISFETDLVTYGVGANNLWFKVSTNKSRHIGKFHVYFNKKHLVSDYSTGKIYELKSDAYTDNGAKIQRIATGQHIHGDQAMMFINALQVEFEGGTALTSGQGSDPVAYLDLSKDGGHTYGNKKAKNLGKQGKYNTRAIWRGLGQCRDLVPRLTIDEPIKIVIMGLWSDIEADV